MWRLGGVLQSLHMLTCYWISCGVGFPGVGDQVFWGLGPNLLPRYVLGTFRVSCFQLGVSSGSAWGEEFAVWSRIRPGLPAQQSGKSCKVRKPVQNASLKQRGA